MEIEVIGVDHVYVSVRNLDRSQRFYDQLMAILGFRKVARPLADGDLHIHYFNRCLQFTLRPASAGAQDHDPYSPGLHHFCFRVADRASVDAIADQLRRRGIDATRPRHYPEYYDDYYATFVSDPDGLRFEVVNHLEVRKEIVKQWEQIPPIGEPVA